jgi:hypothetical protein
MGRVTRGCGGVENGEWRVRIGEWGGLREGVGEWRGGGNRSWGSGRGHEGVGEGYIRGGVGNDCDTEERPALIPM